MSQLSLGNFDLVSVESADSDFVNTPSIDLFNVVTGLIVLVIATLSAACIWALLTH